jgi:hypothetical protein
MLPQLSGRITNNLPAGLARIIHDLEKAETHCQSTCEAEGRWHWSAKLLRRVWTLARDLAPAGAPAAENSLKAASLPSSLRTGAKRTRVAPSDLTLSSVSRPCADMDGRRETQGEQMLKQVFRPFSPAFGYSGDQKQSFDFVSITSVDAKYVSDG